MYIFRFLCLTLWRGKTLNFYENEFLPIYTRRKRVFPSTVAFVEKFFFVRQLVPSLLRSAGLPWLFSRGLAFPDTLRTATERRCIFLHKWLWAGIEKDEANIFLRPSCLLFLVLFFLLSNINLPNTRCASLRSTFAVIDPREYRYRIESLCIIPAPTG